MAIIRSVARKSIVGELASYDEVAPFVPARDLYEAQRKKLTEAEVATIALTLFKLKPDHSARPSNWELESYSRALSNRK